jgi:hypothetical protein
VSRGERFEGPHDRSLIPLHLPQRFPDIPYFGNAAVRKVLTTILFLWAIENEEVGYRQVSDDAADCEILYSPILHRECTSYWGLYSWFAIVILFLSLLGLASISPSLLSKRDLLPQAHG